MRRVPFQWWRRPKNRHLVPGWVDWFVAYCVPTRVYRAWHKVRWSG